jgi:hypothetical protein
MSLIIKSIYHLLFYLIRLNIFLIKKKIKSNYAVCNYPSFGDSFVFCIQNYKKILKNNYKILVYSFFIKKLAELFFEKHKIYKTFFSIPLCVPTYYIGSILSKYLPTKKKFNINYEKKISNKEKKILENILKKKYEDISFGIKNFKDKNYVLFFVKHFNKNANDLTTGPHRQTSDLKKIFQVIKFLINNNLKIIVLGDKKEKVVTILKKFFKNENILYFNEISNNQTMIDQLFLHYHSQFSIGTDCGAFIMSIFLKKKIIFFDSLKTSDKYLRSKNIIFMHKRIKIKNKTEIPLTYMLREKILSSKKKNYKIKESSFFEIKKEINKFLL